MSDNSQAQLYGSHYGNNPYPSPPQQQQQSYIQPPYGQNYHHPSPPPSSYGLPPQQYHQPQPQYYHYQRYQQQQQLPPPLPSSFIVRSSPKKTKSETSVIHQLGHPVDAPPLYSIVTHQYSKPNVVLFRGDAANEANTAGDARFHTFSSNTDLTLRGQSFSMRSSTLSTSHTVKCPGLGTYKWKPSGGGGSGIKLLDESGNTVAKIKSTGFFKFGEKEVQILRPGASEHFVEMVFLTATAARILNKSTMDAAGDAVGNVVGAVAGA